MAANLRLTNAGRAAIVDADNNGINAIRITKLALGAGSGDGGAADDGRTTLRDQRDIVAVTGAANVAGQLAVRAELNSANAYPATEIGLFAQIGAGGAEFLLAYWTDDGAVFINKPANLRTIVATAIVIQRSAADLTVNVAADVSVGTVGTLLDLADSPGSYVNAAKRKVAVKADGTGVEFVSGLLDHEAASDAEARAGVLRTKAVTPAGLKAVVDDLLAGVPGALDTLNELADALGDDPNFSATVTALINARLTQDQVDARIRAIGGGVGNFAFFSLGASSGLEQKNVNVSVSDAPQIYQLPFTPSRADALVGLLLQHEQTIPNDGDHESFFRLRRGAHAITPAMTPRGGQGTLDQTLFLDKPVGTGNINYEVTAWRTQNNFAARTLAVKRSTLMAFEIRGGEADIVAADTTPEADANFLSVAITPRGPASKILLRFLALANQRLQVSSGNAVRLKRGDVTLLDWPGAWSDATPSSKLDSDWIAPFSWLDEPNTTDPVTYHLASPIAFPAGRVVHAGSYLTAHEVL